LRPTLSPLSRTKTGGGRLLVFGCGRAVSSVLTAWSGLLLSIVWHCRIVCSAHHHACKGRTHHCVPRVMRGQIMTFLCPVFTPHPSHNTLAIVATLTRGNIWPRAGFLVFFLRIVVLAVLIGVAVAGAVSYVQIFPSAGLLPPTGPFRMHPPGPSHHQFPSHPPCMYLSSRLQAHMRLNESITFDSTGQFHPSQRCSSRHCLPVNLCLCLSARPCLHACGCTCKSLPFVCMRMRVCLHVDVPVNFAICLFARECLRAYACAYACAYA